MAQHIVVFTDLDGTLLDHTTYSFAAARDALAALNQRHIPLILATSKTAAEIAPLQEALGMNHPAIVENGAGMIVPPGYFKIDSHKAHGIVYANIRKKLASLDPTLSAHFTGFGDWTPEEVAARTGLSVEAASRAKARNWSEPGLWDGTTEGFARFQSAIAPLQAVRGGRFLTLMGPGSKADRMAELTALFRTSWGGDLVSVALGDAPNDRAMIEAADFGIIVANPAHDALPRLAGEERGHIRRTREVGPRGWNRAILDLLDELGC